MYETRKVLCISGNTGLALNMCRMLQLCQITICKHEKVSKLFKQGNFTHIIIDQADEKIGKETFANIRRMILMYDLKDVKILRMGLKTIEEDNYLAQPFKIPDLLAWLKGEL